MTPFNQPQNLRVLITGAAGNIGLCLREQLRGRYALLRLADIAPQEAAQAGEEICTMDVRDIGSLERCMEGIDCVIHLAGIPGADVWEKILPMNIEGCYNVFEAARRQNVRRVVFASSNHAIGYHRREKFLDDSVQPRPDSLYGVSKVFGEGLGRMYADKYGMSVACLRIGTFRTPDRPSEARQLLTWISHRDMAQLAARCVEHESYHFTVVYGVSNNLRNRWDNSNAKFLGYAPQDDSEAFAPEILAQNIPEDPIAAQFHGGFYCPLEFVGTTDRIS
ncbi:NAD(P)-dependent oxidoreductase [Achromobacter sp.]|uniref:NAD-dependent epimerase/dehydratase family protein n=1 Tax=Achromobacter sp. TaxID=134375 RepID=UPI002F93DED6